MEILEKRRRLPLWMSGVTAADKLRSSGQEDVDDDDNPCSQFPVQPPVKNSLNKRKQPALVACGAKRKSRSVRDPIEDDDDDHDGDLKKTKPKKGKAAVPPKKKRKPKIYKIDEEDDIEDPLASDEDGDLTVEDLMNIAREVICNNDDDGAVEKEKNPSKKRKTGGVRGERKTKKGKAVYREEDVENSLSADEGGDLTVDDLVSIAEEYVKADEEGKKHQTGTLIEVPSERQVSTIGSFFRDESEATVCYEAAQSSGALPAHTTSGCLKDQENAYEDITSIPSTIGDPTQDMLSLFLGPLLKKPETEERKREELRKEINLDYEFMKYSQTQKEVPQGPLLTKKKSSLRDRVAMFLD